MPEVTQGDYIRYQRTVIPDYSLADMPQVPGIGPDVPHIPIAFLGEAPGSTETQQRKPFVGDAGKYLHGYLKAAGIHGAACYFTNVIDRQPPNNNIKSPQAKQAIIAQKQELWAELAWLKTKGCKVVVALGNTAKEALGIPDSITKCRGSLYEISLTWQGVVTDPAAEPCDLIALPTYHPSFLQRGYGIAQKSGDMKTDLKQIWVADLIKAQEVATKGYARPIENFIINPTYDQVATYINQHINSRKLIAVDIETSGFNSKHDKIVCIGLADSRESGICIPLYKTGPYVIPSTRYWNPSEESYIKAMLEDLFNKCPLAFQNALFDVDYLQQSGWSIPCSSIRHDTMLLHHAINPEMPHKLDFIVSAYGATPYWKADFINRSTTIWHMDDRDLQTYNLRDCIVLHQVIPPMLKDLNELRANHAYQQSIDLIPSVLQIKQTGVHVSKSRYKLWLSNINQQLAEVKQQLISLGNLPANFDFKPAEVILFLFGMESPKHAACKDYTKHREGTKVREAKEDLFNLIKNIKPLWTHSYTGKVNENKLPSIDGDNLLGLRIYANNRLSNLSKLKTPKPEEQQAINKLIQWLILYNKLSELTKLESMFRELPIRSDSRLHPNILIHGTATGRLSCSKPNLQQVPKNEVREIFTAPAGHIILAADYDSLEFRIMAYECGDKKMLEIVNQGLNQHDENTKAIFNIDSKDPNWKLYRHTAKTYQFASQYGAGDAKLHQTLMLAVPELNLTRADVKQMRSAFERNYSGWARWATVTQQQALDTKRAVNAFGRIRTFYGSDHEVKNQALNYPIQSAAAFIINDAMIRITRRLRNSRARMQIQIHDELRFELPKSDIGPVAKIIKSEMERPVNYRGQKVVFPVKLEVGPNWHNLVEYGI